MLTLRDYAEGSWRFISLTGAAAYGKAPVQESGVPLPWTMGPNHFRSSASLRARSTVWRMFNSVFVSPLKRALTLSASSRSMWTTTVGELESFLDLLFMSILLSVSCDRDMLSRPEIIQMK